MDIKEMKFSVLMSVYYKEKPEFFLEAVESVINQTIKPAEIVIVKDGALTESLEEVCSTLLHKYPSYIRFVSLEKNVGLGLALQKGVLECRYDLIARMDTDDIAKKYRFEYQIKEFLDNPDIAVCGGYIEEFSNNIKEVDSIRKVPLSNKDIIIFAKKRNPFNHMTVMFRKQAVLAAGNYQPFLLLEDYYLWYRILKEKKQVKNIPIVLVSVRADDGMIVRRGGMSYFKHEAKLYKLFYEDRYINEFEYVLILIIRLIGRICPIWFRSFLYKSFLR